ncbi:MAG: restriction endonuclease [Acidobacteriota bacterium]|nr:restriction endonuclease [Acidobacteriota bacterium]
MAIPDYQSIMLPLLHFVSDKTEHSAQEATTALAKKFGINETELQELLPSGKQTIFRNRVGWARTYLSKAGLLKSSRRGFFQISERGLDILSQDLNRIDNKILRQFSEFNEFQNRKNDKTAKVVIESVEDVNNTPEESLENAYQTIRNALAAEIIEKIKSCSSAFFERLVVELLVKMGYGGTLQDAGKAVGKSGDGGIDGIIKEDRLGLDVIYLQAKRWEGNVSRPEIQKFAGALLGNQARKGVFITTSDFTKEAKGYVKTISSNIILLNGEELAELMIDYNVGVSNATVYEIKKVDSDYFIEE